MLVNRSNFLSFEANNERLESAKHLLEKAHQQEKQSLQSGRKYKREGKTIRLVKA